MMIMRIHERGLQFSELSQQVKCSISNNSELGYVGYPAANTKVTSISRQPGAAVD